MISPADYELRVTHAATPRRKTVGFSAAAPRHKKLSDLKSKLSENPTILGHSPHPGLDAHGEAGVFHLHCRLPVTHLIPALMVWQLAGACPYEFAGFAIWDG